MDKPRMPVAEARIVEASPADIERLYALASENLVHDRFSPRLLYEKLFENPHPDRDMYVTLLAEAGGQACGFLQHVIRDETRSAWLGLFAVAAHRRRQGVASCMYRVALETWQAHRVRTVNLLTVPTNYLVPGLDPRYTAAMSFLEANGFARVKEVMNMRAPLDRDFDATREEEAFKAQGIVLRRASRDDADRIERFFARIFGDGWLAETRLALRREPPAVHLALSGDEVIGFAAHSTMNAEWGNFGPMGTAEEARGRGLGRILLWRCLADLKAAGFSTAVIPWVGPWTFYSRWAGAAIERVFWHYRLELET